MARLILCAVLCLNFSLKLHSQINCSEVKEAFSKKTNLEEDSYYHELFRDRLPEDMMNDLIEDGFKFELGYYSINALSNDTVDIYVFAGIDGAGEGLLAIHALFIVQDCQNYYIMNLGNVSHLGSFECSVNKTSFSWSLRECKLNSV